MAPLFRHICSISRYSVILFCRFLAAIRLSGLMFSKPDEGAAHARLGRLLDEARDLVAERIDLDGEAEIHALAVPHLDQPVEQRLPVAIAGEIVVGDEEALDALGVVLAHDLFQIVRRADAALAPLHVDDGAERALVGAAAAEIDARQVADGALHVLARQERRRLAGELRQVVHVVVQRLERAVVGVAQHLIEPVFFRLAGEKRNAHLLRGFDVGRQFRQHGDAAGDMESADADRQAGLDKRLAPDRRRAETG